jgi:hypothetical protein
MFVIPLLLELLCKWLNRLFSEWTPEMKLE